MLVEEHEDKLVFENSGEFYDGEPRDYLLDKRRARRYRNPALVQAMTNMNMIDHVGYGIRRISGSQAKRFLPLPDYALTEDSVRLTIYGAQIDKKYSELLMQHTDLDLVDIFALDRVQKSLPIDLDAAKRLRQRKLVEGRFPNLHISASIARATGDEANYFRVRAIEDAHFEKLIVDYLQQLGPTSKKELETNLWEKLPAALDDGQRGNKVKNLLAKLRRQGAIESVASARGTRWRITQPK